jgi:amino acid adenylation domain-containing protein
MFQTVSDYIKSFKNESAKGITFIQSSGQDEFVSYSAQLSLAMQMLGSFQHAGLAAGDLLIIGIEDNKDFITSFWACLLGGIVAVPLSAATTDDNINKTANVFKQLASARLLANRENMVRLQEAGLEFAGNGSILLFEELDDKCEAGVLHGCEASSVAYIQYSSGSTGAPKGVVLTHENLVCNVKAISARSIVSGSDSMLSWMPLTHDMGLTCFHLTAVFNGCSQYIMSTGFFIRRPAYWMDAVHKYRATLLYSPNFGLQYFLKMLRNDAARRWDLTCVRLIYSGAEHIVADTFREFLERMQQYQLSSNCFFPGYGLAEAAVAVTLPEPGHRVTTLCLDRDYLNIGDRIKVVKPDSGAEFTELGKVVDGCFLRLCDDLGNSVGESIVGHIEIKGGNVTAGYYGSVPENEELFSTDGWLKTGDVGFVCFNALYVTGRKKNIIIVNGRNFYPGDIESLIVRKCGIQSGRVIVCGTGAASIDKEGFVVFIATGDSAEAFENSRNKVNSTLFEHTGLIPLAVVQIAKVPKTTSGKIQHFKLLDRFRRGDFGNQPSADLTQLNSEELAVLYNKMSGNHIAQDESFLKMGITSLQAMQFLWRVNERFNTKLTVRDFYEGDTLGGLAVKLEKVPSLRVAEASLVNKDSTYQLSPLQRRFYLLEMLKAGGPLNVAMVYSIRGNLDTSALEFAVRSLIERHESLQFVVSRTEDNIVFKKADLSRTTHFLSMFEENQDGTGISPERFLKEGVNGRFDLVEGPGFRFWLLKSESDRHLFLFAAHHVLVDGWSLTVIARELSIQYNSFTTNNPADLQPLLLPSQQAVLSAVAVSEDEKNIARQYWKSKLKDFDPLFFGNTAQQLKKDEQQQSVYLKKVIVFEAAYYNTVKGYCGKQAVTPFMLVTSCLCAAIYRIWDRSDILIGTDDSGRNSGGAADVVGCFIRTLILRVQVDGQASFPELLANVKETVLDAIHYSAYSYESILRDFKMDNQVAAGLFNALVLFQSFDTALVLQGVDVEQHIPEEQYSMTDIQFEFIERSGQLILNCVYDSSMFYDLDVAAVMEGFREVLFTVTKGTQRCINDLEVLPESTKYLIEHEISNGKDARTKQLSVIRCFESTALRLPNAIACKVEDTQITYHELDRKARAFAHFLTWKFNLTHSDRVVLVFDRGADPIVSMLAVMKISAICVPVDAQLPAKRIADIVEQVHPKLLLTDNFSLSSDLAGWTVQLFHTDLLDAFSQTPSGLSDNLCESAFIMFTSGSTGKPKGVTISNTSFAEYVNTFQQYFDLSQNDRMVQQASLGFDIALEEIFPILCAGGTLVIHKNGGRDIDGLATLIEQNACTILSTIPSVLFELNRDVSRLGSLRTIISGGDVLRFPDVNNLCLVADVYNTYGPTETTICATYYKVLGNENPGRPLPIGRPIAGKKVYVLNDRLKIQPVGVEGEIYIAGSALSLGYWQGDSNSKLPFLQSPFCSEDRLYRTGDRGRWLADGNLDFVGRYDRQVKNSGYRIELSEIEYALSDIPEVDDAVALFVPVDGSQKLLVAYYTGKVELQAAYIRSRLRLALPEYMIPSQILFLSRFEYLTNGKIDRNSLSQRDFIPTGGRGAEFVCHTANEKIVVDIYRDVLGLERLSPDANLFIAGGNSIKAFQIAARIEKAFGKRLDLKYILSDMSIREVAAQLTKTESVAQGDFIRKLVTTADVAASHAQRRIWILEQKDAKPGVNNLTWSYHMTGRLDLQLWENVFVALITRHEALRTVFYINNGMLIQHVQELLGKIVDFHDLRDVNDPIAMALKITGEFGATLFDTGIGPLFRVQIVQIKEREFVLSIVLHHIVADGYSLNLLAAEIAHNYNAFISGRIPRFGEPDVSYRDFVLWEMEQIDTAESHAFIERMRQRASGIRSESKIPVDNKRAERSSGNSLIFKYGVRADINTKILQFCRAEGISLPVFLIACINCYMYAQNGETEVSIGLLLNGRSRRELENVVGFFVNILPLIQHIESSGTFVELVRSVQTNELDLINHQYYPYDILCENIANSRTLVNILVSSVIEERNPLIELSEHTVREFGEKAVWRNDFDMALVLESGESGGILSIFFNQSLYNKTTIDVFGEQLIGIMASVLNNPSEKISALRRFDDISGFDSKSLEALLETLSKQAIK